MVKWKVLKDIDLQLIALKDIKKHGDPDVPLMKKKCHYFVKWLEELVLYLMSMVGVRGVPLAYLA